MTRRKKIRAAAFCAALLAALLVWGIRGSVQTKALRYRVRAAQERALLQTGEYLSGMEASLQKAACAVGPSMLGTLCAELRTQATGAKTSLAALSSGDTELYNLYKFLSQVSAYTESLSRRAAAGETLGEKDSASLRALTEYARSLSQQFGYMSDLLEAGLFSFEAIDRTLAETDAVSADTVSYLSAASDAEESMKDFPTLIYDGPFSDHISEKESALLKEAGEISSAEAARKAAAALETEARLLTEAAPAAGRLPTWNFYKDGVRAAVTVRGGYLAYLLSDRAAGEEKLSAREAIAAAGAFLEKNGYPSMESTYYVNENGVCVINFAYRDGDYLCYPDLIKVGVSLTDGSVVSMDARDYLMNHYAREIPAEAVSRAQAAASAAPDLQVKKTSRAVIPTAGGYEKYCWELLCADAAGQDMLVYVDTETGQEDDILILLYADGGAMTR
jgi:germination protein YpeB